MKVERIYSEIDEMGRIDHLATIIRNDLHPIQKQVEFFTDESAGLQVARISYMAGDKSDRHYHPARVRTVTHTEEVLVVCGGSIEIEFYDSKQHLVTGRRLVAGETAILLRGGHKVMSSHGASIIEVKQGPFHGPQDKVHF